MTRLLQTCHSESPPWAVLNRTMGPVNTPNIQSHRPVSPAVLFKHLLKRTLFCNVNSLRRSLLGLLLHYTLWNLNPERKRERQRGRKSMEGKITLYSGSIAPLLSSSPSASWRTWLRDRATKLRAIQTNRSYAPDLLSKPPKLDYWDPRSKAYITSTCETLAGLLRLACLHSFYAHRWMVKGNMRRHGREGRNSWWVSPLGPYRTWGLV